jgi:hypothetical protein
MVVSGLGDSLIVRLPDDAAQTLGCAEAIRWTSSHSKARDLSLQILPSEQRYSRNCDSIGG